MASILAALALTIAALPSGGQQNTQAPAAWRYVLPAPGDEFEHAPFRALVLRREKPDELIEKAKYRGVPAQRRYAQIRFGSPSSTRVTVVVDTLASGDVDLYADTARTLSIDDRDRVNPRRLPQGPRREWIWQVPLDVALVEQNAVKTIPRSVVLRWAPAVRRSAMQRPVTSRETSRLLQSEPRQAAKSPRTFWPRGASTATATDSWPTPRTASGST